MTPVLFPGSLNHRVSASLNLKGNWNSFNICIQAETTFPISKKESLKTQISLLTILRLWDSSCLYSVEWDRMLWIIPDVPLYSICRALSQKWFHLIFIKTLEVKHYYLHSAASEQYSSSKAGMEIVRQASMKMLSPLSFSDPPSWGKFWASSYADKSLHQSQKRQKVKGHVICIENLLYLLLAIIIIQSHTTPAGKCNWVYFVEKYPEAGRN